MSKPDINSDIPEGAPSVKVGICLDFPIAHNTQVFLDACRLAFDEAHQSGILDRPARLIVRNVEGLPRGDANDVVNAWQELADEGCVGIIGPMISDNCLAVREHMANAPRKVATITWAGTDRQYDEYIFGFGNGSLPEEGYLIAEAIADRGLKTVAVVFERSAPGYEYIEFFDDACRREGLAILHSEGIGQVDRDLTKTVARIQQRNPDALVYFGFGLPGMEMNLAFAAANYDPPRYMCTAFICCYTSAEWMKGLRGWIGVDQYDEENRIAQAMFNRFEQRWGYRQNNCMLTLPFDCANGMAHGIGFAQTLTPFGVMKGLEKVKALPSATGGPGTRLSLGIYNRRAWHGVNYLVLREVNKGATDTQLVARFRN